jgi:hypothetical protein
VVVVVVVSDDDEGGGVTTGAGGGIVPYSVVVVVSLVAVGPHAEQKPTANAAMKMVAHDLQCFIFLILQKNRCPMMVLIDSRDFIARELSLPTSALRKGR